jgi:transcriptional regulator with XRE-family HTH domain
MGSKAPPVIRCAAEYHGEWNNRLRISHEWERRESGMRGVAANGELIRHLRSLKGLTQEALAAAASCDEKTIRKAEKGDRLDVVTVKRVARALGAEYAEIVTRFDEADALERPNLRVVRQWLSAFDQRDSKAIAGLFRDDGVVRLPGTPLLRGTGVFVGKREIARQIELAFEMFVVAPEFSQRTVVAAHGTHVFAETGPVCVTCRLNGQSTTASSVQVFEFKGSKVARLRSYFDISALDALVRCV